MEVRKGQIFAVAGWTKEGPLEAKRVRSDGQVTLERSGLKIVVSAGRDYLIRPLPGWEEFMGEGKSGGFLDRVRGLFRRCLWG